MDRNRSSIDKKHLREDEINTAFLLIITSGEYILMSFTWLLIEITTFRHGNAHPCCA